MNRLLRTLLAAAAALPAASCFTVDHFTGDRSRFDGLYFGREREAEEEATVHDDRWRNYAVWGLIPWDKAQTRFAGERLAQVREASRPLHVAVRSEMTFLNGLTAVGLGLVTGPFGALFFVPRSVEVQGWSTP